MVAAGAGAGYLGNRKHEYIGIFWLSVYVARWWSDTVRHTSDGVPLEVETIPWWRDEIVWTKSDENLSADASREKLDFVNAEYGLYVA